MKQKRDPRNALQWKGNMSFKRPNACARRKMAVYAAALQRESPACRTLYSVFHYVNKKEDSHGSIQPQRH